MFWRVIGGNIVRLRSFHEGTVSRCPYEGDQVRGLDSARAHLSDSKENVFSAADQRSPYRLTPPFA
jgi:hypothetical protein